MKKIFIHLLCFLVVIITILLYLYFGGGKNYVNNNIPSTYKYTQKEQIISETFVILRIKKQIGGSMEYLAGEEYDNQYFYQKEGIIYCKDNNTQPETIIYYLRKPAGYWIFAKIGGYSSRSAFVCGDKYFINDFDNSRGENIYGPFNNEQELSFAAQINQLLKKGSIVKEIDNPNLTLPADINEGQIKNYFKIDNILFALVLRNSMNVVLSLPNDFIPSFAGILVAKQDDTEWTKFTEIKDAKATDKNNPYYLLSDNKNLLLTVVDQNGGGSGEGIMKVFALSETNDWKLENCYYYASYGDPTTDGDDFAFSTKFSKQILQPIESCNNVQLIPKEMKNMEVKDIEVYCTSFGEICPQNENQCEFCGITKASSYASCHSKEFCKNTPIE